MTVCRRESASQQSDDECCSGTSFDKVMLMTMDKNLASGRDIKVLLRQDLLEDANSFSTPLVQVALKSTIFSLVAAMAQALDGWFSHPLKTRALGWPFLLRWWLRVDDDENVWGESCQRRMLFGVFGDSRATVSWETEGKTLCSSAVTHIHIHPAMEWLGSDGSGRFIFILFSSDINICGEVCTWQEMEIAFTKS